MKSIKQYVLDFIRKEKKGGRQPRWKRPAGCPTVIIPKSETMERAIANNRSSWFMVSGFDSPMLRCSQCDTIQSLEDHGIEESGKVHPSIVCDNPKCSWHIFGTLKNWTGGVHNHKRMNTVQSWYKNTHNKSKRPNQHDLDSVEKLIKD